jgi:RimJ/RimL family protein N-acetyltransferase
MTQAPLLTGDTIRRRPHHLSDMEVFWTFYQLPRAALMDVPNNKTHLWYGFASEVGSWALNGMGGWAIETLDGDLAGQVALTHPPHFAETELGWMVFDGFEGRGIAGEAARLALGYARSTLKPASLVSYIHKDNTRSIALAQRLGAQLDPTAIPHDETDVVYRHEVSQ